MEKHLLCCKNLKKNFGLIEILNGVSFSYGQSDVVAIRGPNGAGKSTLLSMLVGVEPIDSGQILINGVNLADDPVTAKRFLSYVPDEAMIYPFMTGMEFLHFVALTKNQKIGESELALSRQFGLEKYWGQRFDRMSLGTQKKFLLTASFIGRPKLLVFDEPTNGLDARSREILKEEILRYKSECVTVFSTHDTQFIDECQAMIAFLDKGIISHGSEERTELNQLV